MRRRIVLAFAFLVALSACAAKREEAATAPQPQPALWAVRDADSTLYLYGTIHMRKQGAAWGGPAAEKALAEAAEVWTEVEIDPARDAELAPVVARYGLDGSRTLSSQLSPARAKQLRDVAASLGLPMATVEQMRPWYAGLTFSILPMMRAGYDPAAGVDRNVDRVAEAAGKRMRWFETGEEQIRFLAGFDDALQVEMLEDTLDEVAKGPAVLERMERAWEVGDDRTLANEMVAELARDFPELYDVILKRRNAAWVEVLSREMAGAGVDFVAVGAAHLVGPDSVQAMMQARGFRVERVSPPAP